MQALWMILGSLFFATMAVCVKLASTWFSSFELVFYRGLLGMLFMWVLVRKQRLRLATRYPGMHSWRSLVGVLALGAWFFAIAKLPLATAVTLNYMSSVWLAAILVGAGLLARSRSNSSPAQQALLALVVLVGFAGVVLMLRPTIARNQLFAGLVGLLSGLLAAFAYLQVSALGRRGEPEARTVFYFSVGSAVAGAVGMTLSGVSPWNWQHALWLLPIGLLASFGQLCMTRAYSQGATLVVACLQYLGIVFGAIYSLALFGDQILLSGWLGMALIVASGIGAAILRARAGPQPAVPARQVQLGAESRIMEQCTQP